MITGVNHITLAVADLKESFAFYREILGFHPLAYLEGKSAYLLAGGTWIALVEEGAVCREPKAEYTSF